MPAVCLSAFYRGFQAYAGFFRKKYLDRISDEKALTLLVTVGPAFSITAAPTTGEAKHAEHTEGADGHVDDHGGHAELKANPFAGNFLTAAVAVGVFAIVMIVLKMKAWGPILEGLQAREGKIKGDLEAAEAAAKEADARLKEYEAKLADAAEAARKMIEEGKVSTEKLVATLKAEAEKEINNLKERSEKDILAAREQAITDVYTEAAELATAVASKILKRDISAGDQSGLVQESLSELGKINRN